MNRKTRERLTQILHEADARGKMNRDAIKGNPETIAYIDEVNKKLDAVIEALNLDIYGRK